MSERKWTGKSKGGKTGHKIFILLLKYFGLRPAYILLYFVSAYYFLTSWKSNKSIYIYFRMLGYGKIKSIRSIYKNYYIFGQTLIDRVSAMAELNNKFTFNFDGEEYLRQMVENHKGGIMLSAHAGNWEIAGHYLDRLNTPINIVMFDAEYQNIKEYLESVAGKRKAKVIAIKEDMSHIYQINEALSNNELICIHADRLTDQLQKALNLNFLGKQAKFPYNIFKLIVTFRVPVSFVFAFKESDFHYHFYATQAELYDGDNKESEIRRLSETYVAGLEQKVRKYPTQWFNYYNFWEGSNKC